MQEPLSINIGSSPRDQSGEIFPLGEKVHRQRALASSGKDLEAQA